MSKRIVSIILSVGLLASVMVGCNKTDKDPSDGTKATSTATTEKSAEQKSLSSLIPYKGETVKIRAYVYSAGADVERSHAQILQKEYDKRVGNVEWTWESPLAAEHSTKLMLYMASGDLPDIINFQTDPKVTKPMMMEYGKQGLLMDWAPYIDKMENFKKFAGETDFAIAKSNMVNESGNMYFITEVSPQLNSTGWVLRDDLFMKYAGRVPETIDELYDDLLKVKAANPKAYPLSNPGPHYIQTVRSIALHYGAYDDFFYDYSSKKWKYGPIQDGYKSALQILNKFYNAKLYDPEFVSLTQDMYEKRVASGDIVASYWYNWGKMEKAAESTNTPFSYTMKFLKTNNTQKQPVTPRVVYWANTAISNKSKNKELLAALIDYQYSPEMIELFHYGVEGVTFDKDKNGNKVIQPWIKTGTNPNGTTEARQVGLHGKLGIRFYPYIADATYPGASKYTQKALIGLNNQLFDKNLIPTGDIAYKTAIQPTLTSQEYDALNTNLTTINTTMREYTVKFITGNIGFDKWNEYVDALKKLNIEALTENFNKAEARKK